MGAVPDEELLAVDLSGFSDYQLSLQTLQHVFSAVHSFPSVPVPNYTFTLLPSKIYLWILRLVKYYNKQV